MSSVSEADKVGNHVGRAGRMACKVISVVLEGGGRGASAEECPPKCAHQSTGRICERADMASPLSALVLVDDLAPANGGTHLWPPEGWKPRVIHLHGKFNTRHTTFRT